MTEGEMRERFAASPVARLATASPDGRPHVVPVCFALVGDAVWWAVDGKPKATSVLRRVRNLRANPRAALLVDHYEDDWQRLWWVRADGMATEVAAPEARAAALPHLQAKYEAYRSEPPGGPWFRVDVGRWSGWRWRQD